MEPPPIGSDTLRICKVWQYLNLLDLWKRAQLRTIAASPQDDRFLTYPPCLCKSEVLDIKMNNTLSSLSMAAAMKSVSLHIHPLLD